MPNWNQIKKKKKWGFSIWDVTTPVVSNTLKQDLIDCNFYMELLDVIANLHPNDTTFWDYYAIMKESFMIFYLSNTRKGPSSISNNVIIAI